DGVRQQGDAACDQDDRQLQSGGDRQDHEGPLDRPNAARRRGNGRVYDPMGMATTARVAVGVTAMMATFGPAGELVEAEPGQDGPEQGGSLHRYFEISLNSSIGARFSREAGPT